MSNELEYNPATGEVEPVKKAIKIKIPAGLRYSRFVDEGQSGVFNLAVQVGAVAYFAKELDEEFLDEVTNRMAEDEALRARLTAVFAGKDTAAINKASKQITSSLKAQRVTFGEVLERTLVGWTLERPFSPEAVKSLSVSTKAELARKIVQASQVGAEEADFLSAVS